MVGGSDQCFSLGLVFQEKAVLLSIATWSLTEWYDFRVSCLVEVQ